MILLTILLQQLSSRWGQPCDVIASGGSPHLVFQGLPFVGDVVTIRSRRTPYFLAPQQWDLVRWLRHRGPSPAFVVEDMAKVDWLLSRGGLPLSHRISMRDVPRGDLEHVASYLRRLGRACPPHYAASAPGLSDAAEPDPQLAITHAEQNDCQSWLGGLGWEGQPLILFQTQSRRLKRGRWPEEKWTATIRSLLAEVPDAWMLLLGAPAEALHVEALRQACSDPRVHNVARDLSLRRLFALTTLAHSCVSLDTGPAHVAAAFACPVVVLTGMADPRRNRPVGPPERVQMVTAVPFEEWPATRRQWEAWHDMTQISVADVLAAWRQLKPRVREM